MVAGSSAAALHADCSACHQLACRRIGAAAAGHFSKQPVGHPCILDMSNPSRGPAGLATVAVGRACPFTAAAVFTVAVAVRLWFLAAAVLGVPRCAAAGGGAVAPAATAAAAAAATLGAAIGYQRSQLMTLQAIFRSMGHGVARSGCMIAIADAPVCSWCKQLCWAACCSS